MRIFGAARNDIAYEPRRAAYAVIRGEHESVAAVCTRRGYFLPGGGAFSGETAAQTVTRELLEELGRDIELLRVVGTGVQYYEIDGRGIRMRATFFAATFASEAHRDAEYALLWAHPRDAGLFFHESHAWAAGFVADDRRSTSS
jgi:ADP-ribose pyrophosphatase YjhB (NUDIX family)